MVEGASNWRKQKFHNWKSALPVLSSHGTQIETVNEKRDEKSWRGLGGDIWGLVKMEEVPSCQSFTAATLTFTVPKREPWE